MFKLFSSEAPYEPVVSCETFIHRYQSLSRVSTESVSTFLSSVHDSLASIARGLNPQVQRLEADLLRYQQESIAKSKEVSFKNFSAQTLSKPESFQGYYTDYVRTLQTHAEATYSATQACLQELKMLVGSFINDYSDEVLNRPKHTETFRGAQRSLLHSKTEVKAFFPLPANKVMDTAQNLLKRMSDVQDLYALVTPLCEVFSDERQKALSRDAQNVSELIDSLLETNRASGVLNKTNGTKQQLMDAIHTSAQMVEYYFALLSHWLMMGKALQDLSEKLRKHQ